MRSSPTSPGTALRSRRGNHETGAIDEQAHYDFVKESLAGSGLGYFDDMMFHFGYHNAAEVKNNRSFIRADDRLSKEGLVRHLCLSQHSYQGNWKVKDGEPAYEILTAGHGESLWTRSADLPRSSYHFGGDVRGESRHITL